jgi:nucleotide-binding universal stress UspA family protein
MDLGPGGAISRMVAVGVDGSAESAAAARYAVKAATERGLNVLLVHAYEPPAVNVPLDQSILDSCRRRAEQQVAQVAAQLVVPSDMMINTWVPSGSRTAVLLHVARLVPILVVGQDHPSWGERLVFGRVASQVAQRAECPVVVVPAGWHASRMAERHPVVVALEGDSPAQGVLEFAFEQATFLGTGLVALHAAPSGARSEDIAMETANLTELLAGWKQDYPQLRVDSVVIPGDEDATLLRWSKSAAVLLVQRPQRHWWKPSTHSVISAVLQQTRCPLILVPADQARRRVQTAIPTSEPIP